MSTTQLVVWRKLNMLSHAASGGLPCPKHLPLPLSSFCLAHT